MNIHISF